MEIVGDPWRHPAFRFTLGGALVIALSASLWWGPLEGALTRAEFAVAGWLDLDGISALPVLALPAVAFAGGVLASFSPCVLPLVPLNLAYIGAHEATGWRSLVLSLRFATGAAAALAVLGLFGSLAGLLLAEYRGVTQILLGAVLFYFGLALVEIAPLPFAASTSAGAKARRKLGPVGAGATFSLVTTPCSSPILGALLVAAAAHPVPGLPVVTMLCFSFGYTLLVLAGGVLGGGIVVWVKRFRWVAPRAAAAALLVAFGLGLTFRGALWF